MLPELSIITRATWMRLLARRLQWIFWAKKHAVMLADVKKIRLVDGNTSANVYFTVSDSPTEGSVRVFGLAVLFFGVIGLLKLNPSSLMFLFSVISPSPSVCLEYSSCPRLVSLLCSLICGLSPVLCLFLSFLLPLSLSWGCAWKPSLFYFFFRGRWIFQFCIFLSLFFVFPLFFRGPFDVSVDSLSFRLDELTDLDMLALACAHIHARARCVFLYKKPVTSTCKCAFKSVCQYFPRAAPPTSQSIQFLNTLLTWKEYLHKQLQSTLCLNFNVYPFINCVRM